MNLFVFTFKEGDTFKHSYSEVRKYVYKNVKKTVKLPWIPKILIQVYKDNTQVELRKGLDDLNTAYSQTLSIKVYEGIHLLKRVNVNINWDTKLKNWIVKSVNNNPFW